jgi:hypothetical protein
LDQVLHVRDLPNAFDRYRHVHFGRLDDVSIRENVAVATDHKTGPTRLRTNQCLTLTGQPYDIVPKLLQNKTDVSFQARIGSTELVLKGGRLLQDIMARCPHARGGDGKSELGLDHFEVRHFRSITRHLLITCISHLFLAEFRKRHRGHKSGTDHRPTAAGDAGAGPDLARGRSLFRPARRGRRGAIR